MKHLTKLLIIVSILFASCSDSKGLIEKSGLSLVKEKIEVPAFSLSDQSGKTITKDSLKGSWYLLNFWATWCQPCRAEMPSLDALGKEGSIKILAVDLGEPKETTMEFLKEFPYTLQILLDTESDLGGALGIAALPTTYLVNPQGQIVAGVEGGFDWSSKGIKDLAASLK